jgi:hypothetical protein
MELSSNRYINRSFCEMRFDHSPDKLCFSGSGLPRPDEGSSDLSNSLSNLHRALCSFLSFSRKVSYASHVLPSNTSDLIHLLFGRLVSLVAFVAFKRRCNLLHQIPILEYMQGFLLPLPIIGAQNDKCLTGTSRYFKRLMPTNHLFYNAFQVISKLVYTNGIHKITGMYGNAVQLYIKSPNKAKHNCPCKKRMGWTSLSRGLCWRR